MHSNITMSKHIIYYKLISIVGSKSMLVYEMANVLYIRFATVYSSG